MADANQEYFDAALRRQVQLRRFSQTETRRILELLERADRELASRLRDRLPAFEKRPPDFTSERWKALLAEIRAARAAVMAEYKSSSRETLYELSRLEEQAERRMLTAAIPVEVTFASVSLDQLRAIVTSRPFQGRHLRDWFRQLEMRDQQRLQAAIQLGMTQGETTDDIVRRVVGTRAAGYSDGILTTTRRDATAVVRTAINHVSNEARAEVWEQNSDIIAARIWNSTLDGRTSAICRARDGKGIPVGDNELPEGIQPLDPPNARPPAHVNCRSIMVGYIDGVGLVGRRPTVTDTRNRRRREIDFRAEARKRGVPIQQVRREWAQRNIGGAPADTTYQEWLQRQPAAFQNDVLGPTRGKLFREGGLSMDEFVDNSGRSLTLDQLRRVRPEAFIEAGVD